MKRFIVVEGVCCSGKSTFCQFLQTHCDQIGVSAYYNHGAFTDTSTGRLLRKESEKKDYLLGASYYLSDLIINTQQVIKPALKSNIVIQDRYCDSISTFISAYGKCKNIDCNIDKMITELQNQQILLKPALTIYCVPAFETVIQRMSKSKHNLMHDYYSKNIKFLKSVYDENLNQACKTENVVIIKTDSFDEIENKIKPITQLIMS